MRLVLADPGYFKDSVNVISDLVTEARVKIAPDGIQVIAMDPANVAMVIFKLFSSSFSEYDVAQPMEVGINFANLKQVMRRASPADVLVMEVTDKNEFKIVLKGATTRTFSMALIDIDEKEQKIPNLSFTVTVDLPSSVLNNAIADADIVGDSVSFVAEPNVFIVQAEGDLSKASIEMKQSTAVKVKAEKDVKIRAKYSIEYLKKMIAGGKITDDATLQFNQDYPLKLEYKVLDKLQLAFILAPRVEND